MNIKFFLKKFCFAQKGFGVIEIILVLAVGAGVFLSVEQYLNLSLKSIDRDTNQTEAIYWAKATLEQARAVRDENWTGISSPSVPLATAYHFATSGTSPDKWRAVAGSQTAGKYTMWFKTFSVQRDIDKDIVSSGGTIDGDTLKIVASVSWNTDGTAKQIDISEYLVNYK